MTQIKNIEIEKFVASFQQGSERNIRINIGETILKLGGLINCFRLEGNP